MISRPIQRNEYQSTANENYVEAHDYNQFRHSFIDLTRNSHHCYAMALHAWGPDPVQNFKIQYSCQPAGHQFCFERRLVIRFHHHVDRRCWFSMLVARAKMEGIVLADQTPLLALPQGRALRQ